MYVADIYDSAEVAINQHAGISPYYKGSYTTENALLKSDFRCIGSTVHLLSDFADEGAIVSKKTLHLKELDSPAKIFIRNCALGNEMILNVVGSIVKGESVTGQRQEDIGTTFYSRDFGAADLAILYLSYFLGFLHKQILLSKNEN